MKLLVVDNYDSFTHNLVQLFGGLGVEVQVIRNDADNWQPMVEALLADVGTVDRAVVAVRFHNTLADMICAVAKKIGTVKIVLSGGTFQNRLLVEKALSHLNEDGFQVYTHQQVPPNDGGIALGQIAALNFMSVE